MALAKIAQLEAAREPKRSTPKFDQRAFELDPLGQMQSLGIDVNHVTKHVVRNALGDAAPQHLKDYVDAGKQYSAVTSGIESKLEHLSRRLEDVIGGRTRESFKTLAADKTKYPNLAVAYAADPESFGDVQGDPAEQAAALEAKYAKFAAAFKPQPESQSSATSAQADQAKPAANAGALQGTPPPVQTKSPGIITDDLYEQLKQETVRQYEK